MTLRHVFFGGVEEGWWMMKCGTVHLNEVI